MITLAFANQKGGTGKSTSAAAIGAYFRHQGARVLFLDLDAQGNLTYQTGGIAAEGPTIADLFARAAEWDINADKVAAAIRTTEQGDIIASAPTLSGMDMILTKSTNAGPRLIPGAQFIVKKILQTVAGRYDYAIIDCPPGLGTLTFNALTAADGVIAPVQADIFGILALQQLAGTIAEARKDNSGLAFMGVVLTFYKPRTVVSKEATAQLEKAAAAYGTRLYTAKVRECTALKEAAIVQRDIFTYAPRSNAAADYKALAEEIEAQLGKKPKKKR